MKYARVLIFLVFFLPQIAGAQFVESFTIETEITEENSSGTTTSPTTPSGGSGQTSTRVDRDTVDSFTVPNVRNIRIIEQGEQLQLEWENPPVNFASIRVVRGDFFAKDIYDGWVVFNDRGETVRDVLLGENGVFYTFFVVMPDGQTSSGVSTFYKAESLEVGEEGQTELLIPSVPEEQLPPPDPVPEPDTPDIPSMFTLDAMQQGDTMRSIDASFITPFGAHQDITFVIPAYAVPPEIKSVVLTLENKETDTFERYLLRRQENEFFAAVPRRLIAGEYRLIIDLYDFESINRVRYQRTIDIYPHYFVMQDDGVGKVLLIDYIIIIYALLALFFLLFLWRVWKVIKSPAV
jgi:hypothetical protein